MPNLILYAIAMLIPPWLIIFAWQPIAKWRNPGYKPETGMSGITSGQSCVLIVWVIVFSVTTFVLFKAD